MRELLNKNLLTKMFVTFISTGFLGTIALMLVFCISTEKIVNHVNESIGILKQETNYFSVTPGQKGSLMDNYTEALYLNEAMVGGSKFKSALSGYMYTIPHEGGPVEELDCILKNLSEAALVPGLVRFFNGYEVIIKPLLRYTTYSGIRQINIYGVFLLYLWLCHLLIKKDIKLYVIPFTLTFLFINPITVALNLTFVFFYYCTIIPCIIILLKNDWLNKGHRYIIFFQLTGAAVFYFNMNYFQLISFGIPLIFFFLINGLPEKKIELLSVIFKFFTAWFLGYVGMMVFKWILYASFYDLDFFTRMYNHILFRTSDHYNEINFGRIDAILLNIKAASNKYFLILEACFIMYVLNHWRKNKNNYQLDKEKFALELLFVFMMVLLPFARFFIFANHVSIHHWTTFRILAMTVLAINIFIIRFCYGLMDKHKQTNV